MKFGYRSSAIDKEGKIEFNNFELKTGAYLRVIWNAFFRYETKCSIELDMTIEGLIEDIVKM